MARCGYTSDTMCECDQSEQTVQHMLQCQLLDKPCSILDLADATKTAMMCVNKWKKRWKLMMDSIRRRLRHGTPETSSTRAAHIIISELLILNVQSRCQPERYCSIFAFLTRCQNHPTFRGTSDYI